MNFGESKETEEALDRLEAELAENAERSAYAEGMTLAEVPELVPEEDDPSVLFRNNWLAYGQSFLLTSSSGVGKSSMVVQMAYHWSLGRTFMAAPMRPLKICIIQAEDSERDVAEQRQGMRRGLVSQGWTGDDIAEAESRIFMPGKLFTGKVSDKFAAELRKMQSVMRFDLIIINPAQSFFGGDVADQEATSHFCRELLDPIMKNPSAPCCIGVVTHTPKQKSGTKDGKSNVDDYGEYITAGSHEWTDWARAVLVFMKHGQTDGLFDFKAAKRGKRMGWTDTAGKPTTKKTLKHAEGYIFWLEADQSDLSIVDMAANEKRRIEEERMAHDKGTDANVRHLAAKCDQCHAAGTGAYNSDTIRDYARGWWTKSVADAAVKRFRELLTVLGFTTREVTANGRTRSEFIRPEWLEEGLEDAEF